MEVGAFFEALIAALLVPLLIVFEVVLVPFPGKPKRCELLPGPALDLVIFAAAGISTFRGDESGSNIDANDCAAGDRRISLLPGNFNGGSGGREGGHRCLQFWLQATSTVLNT